MFLLDDAWVASPSDLVTALACEYQLLHKRAERAGLVTAPESDADPIHARAVDLGIAHEEAVLAALVAQHGEGAPGGVVSIDRPDSADRGALERAHRLTAEAMAGGAEIVYQGAFFDGTFHGLADFLVRTVGPGGTVRYEPADTKLARHAKVEAMLQLAAYGHQLELMGWPAPEQVHLWLGDGTQTHHRYADLRPVLLDRLARLRELLDAPVAVPPWGTDELRWCGWCDHCRAAADARRDVLLVAGVRVDQRPKLLAAGLDTVEALAAAGEAPSGIKEPVFAKLAAQARLQAAQDASVTDEQPDGQVTAELADAAAIALIPPPNPGDVFFDFEGDPLHTTEGWNEFGLEYLWGVLTHGPGAGTKGAVDETEYWPLWAHDRVAEREALEQFIDWLMARRRQPGFEGLHVYHYAPYEISALKRLVQRYATRADELDELLKDGVFVDLYGVVRRGVRVSQRSYSIKKLEPLYMGAEEYRGGEVADGAASVVVYEEYRASVAAGDDAAAQDRLRSLADYNRDDCLSTLRLRDWLIEFDGALRPDPDAVGLGVSDDEPSDTKANPARDLAETLRAPLVDIAPANRTPAQQATLLLAAALEYHRREVLPFWWDHFRRVGATVEEWERDGEVVVLDPSAVSVVTDWHLDGKRWTRTFELTTELPGAFKLSADAERDCFAIYDQPLPPQAKPTVGTHRGYASTLTLDAVEHLGARSRVTITERLPAKVTELEATHQAFPVALSADAALEGRPMAKAILDLAADAVRADGSLEPHPALDVLQRLPPRLRSGGALPEPGADIGKAIGEAVRDLDRSYLAVQGPPGTGKSTTGARVIAELVRDGWKVGVVAQSHRTVEGLLDKVVSAGADPELVLKKEKGSGPIAGTLVSDAQLLAAATAPVDPGEPGVLIGGTSWDFVSDKRVPAGSLDLLVIDEAGQFSLADTLAVSRAAPRLLLLGDPQQLPQVSQARHSEPVDRAGLGWLADGHDTLPPGLGYFLDRTWRMRPELTSVVSHLSYDDRLEADGCTADRTLEGIRPGVVTELIAHTGNRAASAEEVARVVALVDELLGRIWHDPHDRDRPEPRPLDDGDVLVVAPFNAQVNRLREALDGAGHRGVAVGTVDKFQGREAPVVIVSMAASVADNSSRGPGFLLSRHRLNVAISRAQHTAFLIHSPQLTDFVPYTPEGLTRLGAFLGVSQAGRAPAGP